MPSLPAGTFPSTYDNNQYTSLEKNPGTGYLTTSGAGAGSGSTSFDGNSDYLLTATDSNLVIGSGDFTAECWIYPKSFAAVQGVIDRRRSGDAANYDWTTYLNTDNTINFYAAGGTRITSSALSTNTWYHTAVVKNSGTTTLYVDGVSQGTWSDSATYPSNQITFGAYGPSLASLWYDGYISNFRLVIGTAVYTSNFTKPSLPLTAITNTELLTCQNSTGTITDASSNNISITASGNAAATTQMPFVSSTTTTSLNLIAFDSANSPERFNTGTIYSILNNGLLARVATRDSQSGFAINPGDSNVTGAGEITPLIGFDSANSVERYTQGTLYHDQVPAAGNNPGILVKMLTRDSLSGFAFNLGDSSVGNVVGAAARLLKEDSANGVGTYNTGTIYGDVQKTALNTLLSTRAPRTNFKGNIGAMADSSGGGVGGVSGGGQITYTEILLNF